MLLRARDLRAGGATTGTLQSAVRRGTLVRVRRGWYCDGALWRESDALGRHLLRAAAVSDDGDEPLLFAETAAVVWGIPLLGDPPEDVMVLAAASAGGKSEPGVRRSATGWRRAPRSRERGLVVTPPARTAVDLACVRGFTAGVVAMDHLLARGVPRSEFEGALMTRTSRYGSAAARTAIAFADARAESPGESVARAAFLLLGFEVPDLQVAFRDDDGLMRVDFFWRATRTVGEFDGRLKYTGGSDTGGADVLWREKLREDRLRRQVDSIVRLTWRDVRSPDRLARLLSAAGVPRSARGITTAVPVRRR